MPNTFSLPTTTIIVNGERGKDYLLFALRTRLIPRLQKMLGKRIDVNFSEGSLIHVGYSYGELYMSTDMYEEVKDVIEDEASSNIPYCLLLDPKSEFLDINNPSWVLSMLPFISSVSQHQIKIHDGKLFIDLREFIDYKIVYSNILTDVLAELKNKYDGGYIVSPTKSLIEKWKLVPVIRGKDGNSLYSPDNWYLHHSIVLDTPLSLLFQTLTDDTKDVKIGMYVGLNMVDYHHISDRVFKGNFSFFFEDSKVFFTPTDVGDLLNKTSQINEVIHGMDSYGKVLCMYASRLSWMRIYAVIAQRAIPGKYTVYVRRDIKPVFVFSITVPDDTNLDELEYEMRIRGHRLLLYLMEKLNPPDGDIHTVLDNAVSLPQELNLPPNFVPGGLSSERLKEHNILF